MLSKYFNTLSYLLRRKSYLLYTKYDKNQFTRNNQIKSNLRTRVDFHAVWLNILIFLEENIFKPNICLDKYYELQLGYVCLFFPSISMAHSRLFLNVPTH